MQLILPQEFFMVDEKLAVSIRKTRRGKNNISALCFISTSKIKNNFKNTF